MTSYKLNHTKSVAVSTERDWLKITPDTPRGVKLHLLTVHGVATHGALTEKNIGDFAYWEPLPRIPLERVTDWSAA